MNYWNNSTLIYAFAVIFLCACHAASLAMQIEGPPCKSGGS